METLLTLTLFGSVFWFWFVTAIFVVICFASDVNKNGYYAFGTLIVLTLAYNLWGDVKNLLPLITWLNVGVYLGVGLIFSTFRTYFSGINLGKKIKSLPVEKDKNYYGDTKEQAKERHIGELKGNVFRWWFMWPISMLTWLATDLIKDGYGWIYSRLRKFYEFVLDLGIKSA